MASRAQKTINDRMNRTGIIFTLGLVALSACTTEKLTPDDQLSRHQIQFTVSPIKSSATRATTATFSAFDQKRTFGTSAYLLSSGTWADNRADAELTAIAKEEISCNDGIWKAWKSQKSYYWGDFDGSLNFLSWSPYDLIDNGLSINASNNFTYTGWKVTNTPGYGYTKNNNGTYTADSSKDLLLAESPDCTENNSSTGVLTQFVHQLCNVKLYAKLDNKPEDGETWSITKVDLTGIYTKADLLKAAVTGDNNDGVWGNQSDTLTYTREFDEAIELTYSDDANAETEIFPQTLMIPQSVFSTTARVPKVKITVKITKSDNTTQTKILQGVLASSVYATLIAWEPARSITYHIHISTKDEWIDFDASSYDWNYTDNTDINIVG